jgi:hypothetical protein
MERWHPTGTLCAGHVGISAEKQRENFYKFSAVVYKLTAVSTG